MSDKSKKPIQKEELRKTTGGAGAASRPVSPIGGPTPRNAVGGDRHLGAGLNAAKK